MEEGQLELRTFVLKCGMTARIIGTTSVTMEILIMLMDATNLEELSLDGSVQMEGLGSQMFAGTGVETEKGFG